MRPHSMSPQGSHCTGGRDTCTTVSPGSADVVEQPTRSTAAARAAPHTRVSFIYLRADAERTPTVTFGVTMNESPTTATAWNVA